MAPSLTTTASAAACAALAGATSGLSTLPDGGPRGYENLHDYTVVQEAIAAIDEMSQQDAPWCLFVGTIGPHDPFNVPEKFVKLYDPAQIPLPPNYADSLDDKPRIVQRQRRQLWDQLSEDEVRESIAHYWAYCTLQDELLGEVLDALDASGQAGDTLVVFMSDHGDYVGAHGLYLKGVPAFREAYHVPCIMRWPAGIRNPGRTVDAFVTLADFAPTFLELGEATQPADLSGASLLPFLRNETPDAWPDAYHTQLNGVELYYTQRCRHATSNTSTTASTSTNSTTCAMTRTRWSILPIGLNTKRSNTTWCGACGASPRASKT